MVCQNVCDALTFLLDNIFIQYGTKLNARVLKECSNEISPILVFIFNESLAWGDVPDGW